ncbi:ion channel [Lithospermum erythrorhizon]|uniref:Ion channel n=1 Tax=Lithospermum erythrorhizon TaxID=34254 RepID=A0AAV3R112_LITER
MAASRRKLTGLGSMYLSSITRTQVDVRSSFTYILRNHYTNEPGKNGFRVLGGNVFCRNQLVSSLSREPHGCLRNGVSFSGIRPMTSFRGYASSTGGQGTPADINVQTPPDTGGVGATNGGFGESDWSSKFMEVWQSTVNYTGEKAKEVSDEMTPYVQLVLETHPYLRDVIFPISGTLFVTLMAWVVMPRILKKFHKYSEQGPAALLAGSSLGGPVPYEKSFWGALEDPIRYLVTFMAFSQIAVMVVPTVVASQYVMQVWRGAFVLSFLWFLQRWKTNVISRALVAKSLQGMDRYRLLTLDKFSSVGLFAIGVMAFAEACGVPLQSLLTVGGIGGVATAFAAKDILGNVLSGLSVQVSQPFSIGDTIKAGSMEGRVTEMGLTNTSLLTAERFPVIVPNSLFSSQVIVNKSRAQYLAMTSKIPLQADDLDKIPQITDAIKNMLNSNTNVFLEKEVPYCYLSHIERSYAELTLGCNVKYMRKDKFLDAEQEIRLHVVKIIKNHGASLGSTLQDNVQ